MFITTADTYFERQKRMEIKGPEYLSGVGGYREMLETKSRHGEKGGMVNEYGSAQRPAAQVT